VLISVSIVLDGEASPQQLAELPVVPPRVARIRKSHTAAILDIDSATTSILGWTADDMVGRRSLEFIHPDDQHLAIENWLRLRTNPEAAVRARLRHRAFDGSWLWFEVSQINLPGAPDACVLAEMVDISAEMAAQHALAAREQLLYQLTQTLPLGVFQIDMLGTLVYTNDRLFDIVGQHGTTTVQTLFGRVIGEQQPALQDALAAVLGGAHEHAVDLQLASSAGSQQTCRVILRPLADNGMQTIGVVGCVADVTESVTMRRELEHRASYDNLTGCHNRQAVLARLERDLASMESTGAGTGVIFVDLDLFKSVNDRYGHAAGNEMLIQTAERLRLVANGCATVGCIGGDEFLVVAPDLDSAAAAAKLADAIAAGLRIAVPIGNELINRTASVGVAWTNDPAYPADRLIAEADTAMYASKRERRGRAVCSSHLPFPRRPATYRGRHSAPSALHDR
jgi:diguanylate cyclase (GGDEF)-like protein/PAS domain S-box-containing protein